MIKMTAGRKFSAGAAMRCAKAGILIVFGLLLNTPPLAAAESEMTQEYVTCMEKPGGVTAEMIECMSAETARQDARLNENYKRLMSKLSAKRKKELLEAQRAWIKFWDANCSFYHDPEGVCVPKTSSFLIT
jgi:uncharacterized protein YecT (DUF1311 family)